jgi:hypothetical protein
MAELGLYVVNELMPSVQVPGPMCPGLFVRHKDDHRSFGMIVAFVPNQCSVLWSRAPHLVPDLDNLVVNSQPIVARSRQLKTTWSWEGKPVEFGPSVS